VPLDGQADGLAEQGRQGSIGVRADQQVYPSWCGPRNTPQAHGTKRALVDGFRVHEADTDAGGGLIVDGHHVAPVVMRLALRCKRRDRFMIVTDGMPSIGTTDTSFDLQGRSISVIDGLLLDDNGRLAGSHTDMAQAVRNAVGMLAINLPEAIHMATRNPAAFLGLEKDLGRIAPGLRASLVLADEKLKVLDTWIDGRALSEA
jgi:N-acetylglucosamine-6-phosphate deacetylase